MTTPSHALPDHVHLQAAGVSLLLDCAEGHLPRVLHWGHSLGAITEHDIEHLRLAARPPAGAAQVDAAVHLSVLAEQSAGWPGTPGLTGHREGADFSTAFRVTAIEHAAGDGFSMAERAVITATDAPSGLDLTLEIELSSSGLARMRAAVTNREDRAFSLHSLDLNLPVPTEAQEILDFTGRWARERSPQRHAFTLGTHLRENRRARALDVSSLMAAGPTGFGWRSGEIRALHVGWSGNTRLYAERHHHAVALLAGGELLHAGEVQLGRDETYTGPWLYFSHGDGLDEMAGRFHQYLRQRPEHPTSPRPVQINVWEAVYFDHDLEKLKQLADVAASLGVERYVLDDGWFGSRRDDSSGLGDWVVSPEVWPHGLWPLVDHVRGLGMEFGLWFEPEMVNPDSELARAHPEWILAARPERWPLEARQQQVLDLTIPEAYAHVRDQMLAIVEEYPISYIKWDYNRDLTEPGNQASGRAVVHEQTRAVYHLMDELLAAKPGLEIESCSSGGGRIDLGVMERCVRVWASDCIDPLERQQIEAGTSLLLPPELVGSHVASTVNHTTGRHHSIDFRASTAFFSHMGIEWDLTSATEEELSRLGDWIALYRQNRELLHSGSVVHADHPDESLTLQGVVGADQERALYALTALRTSPFTTPGMVRLPGLDPERRYRVRPLLPGGADAAPTEARTAWWLEGTTLPGRVLATTGIQLPQLNPEQRLLLEVRTEE
ncbi:alpha-galactosidase [Bogoriella caseilytica]|uniref:Alpha-galactosidase n=1 Tax=Bogoriella caseilytica TaxID=56055 RepID=A0A3N2BBZ0_9MICO|nr:alpha-galactosidase [Bogoriella caseilytica]ROR72771.1 alpha-galactosidase [Bogoriella caseilytica]